MLKIAKGFIRIQKKYSDAIKTQNKDKSHIYMNMYVWNQDMKVLKKWSAGISFFFMLKNRLKPKYLLHLISK